ncbi:hypothetical protein [Demetria terragena]|uniref:hypothetical protein n=1 Tax=Demetria terragena TaxID=63959 RepID=UPI00036AD93D|nr:hypothetical protein [Demetria terragena]
MSQDERSGYTMSEDTTPLPTDPQPRAEPQPEEPQWVTGPSSPTVLAGLLIVVIAGLATVRLVTDVDLDWSIAVPVTVIAVGLIAVVLGATSFTRHSRTAEHDTTS